jgi:steroid 5-alpha reductase family enzyme
MADGYAPRRFVVAAMAAIWAGRLALHLLTRMAQEPEDGRHRALKDAWGDSASRNFFVLFQVQALWIVVFAAPMFAAASSTRMAFGRMDSLGVFCWLVALAGESAADRQLARFRSDRANAGRVCAGGLWRYSRHPNYFFEWIHWWAYVLVAVGSPYWWITPAAVALMLAFLTLLKGIPTTEAQALRSRGVAYREYQRTTSAFFPWFPEKESTG